MTTSTLEFEKAIAALQAALSVPEDDLVRDGTIQRFEFTVELAWKTAKRIMGTQTSAPKQVIREMARNGLIEDVMFWLDAIDHRNLSSHTYNEPLAIKVYAFSQRFLPEAIRFWLD